MDLHFLYLKLLRAINSGVQTDSVLRIFAAEINSLIRVWTIQGYVFNRLGNLHLSDWYGISDENLESYYDIEPDLESPINTTRMNSEILILTKQQIIKEYPSSNNWPFIPESIVNIPITRGQELEGILGFSFKDKINNVSIDKTQIFASLHMLAELYTLITVNRVKITSLYSKLQLSDELQQSLQRPKLSPRHSEILTYMGQGLTNKSIAKKMRCSESLIRTEIGRLFAIMGVKSRAEATALAKDYVTSG